MPDRTTLDPTTPAFERLRVVLMGTGLLLALGVIYAHGLSGPFLFDDLISIVANPAIAVDHWSWELLLAAARSGESGPLGRPLAYLSFALNYLLAGGLDPASFKATNLAVHAANAFLIARLSFLLLKCAPVTSKAHTLRWVPWLAATIWAIHPLHLTTVLYTVQRMTSLSTLGVLIGLVLFVQARRSLGTRPAVALASMAVALAVGGIIGLSAKENAVLIVPLAYIIDRFVFTRDSLGTVQRRWLTVFFFIGLGLPGLIALVALIANPGFILEAYLSRDYGPWERLITQARVLFYYIGLLVVPRLNELSLVHDYIVPSTNWFSPWTTAASLVGWGALALIAHGFRRTHPLLMFALVWFLAGHCLESSIIALDLAYEHRNYLPSFGPVLAAAWYLVNGVGAAWDARRAVLASLVLLAFLGTTTWARAGIWSDENVLTEALVRHHPTSARAHGLRAQFYRDAGAPRQEVYRELAEVARMDVGNVTALLEMIRMVSEKGVALAQSATSVSQSAEVSNAMTLDAVLGGWFSASPASRAMAQSVLANEIDKRVLTRPIRGPTVRALTQAANCVVTRQPRCDALLKHTRRWFSSALTQPLRARSKALLLLNSGWLEVQRSPSKAMAQIRQALEVAPNKQEFAIDPVLLHIYTRDWVNAHAELVRLCAAPMSGSLRQAARRAATLVAESGLNARGCL
jgi:hypothetical protein